ncbi:MAG: hypothetical protein V1793_00120 [Pseudomonadota bacterium]
MDSGGLASDSDQVSGIVTSVAIAAMKIIGYDSVNIGPYEALHPELANWEAFVSSNLVNETTSAMFTEPYRLLKAGGLSIGVIGIAMEGKAKDSSSIMAVQPDKALKKILPEVREKADIIVLLSKYNMRETELILKEIDGVDLVISSAGGYAEKVVKTESGTFIIATGTGCTKLQTATIKLDGKKIVDVQKETINLDELVIPDPDVVSITGMDKNATVADLRKKELELIKKKVLEMSKLDPKTQYQKMAEEDNTPEGRKRLERLMRMGEKQQ